MKVKMRVDAKEAVVELAPENTFERAIVEGAKTGEYAASIYADVNDAGVATLCLKFSIL